MIPLTDMLTIFTVSPVQTVLIPLFVFCLVIQLLKG